MKERKLKKEDYRRIKELAHAVYIAKSPRELEDAFLALCYSEAFLTFTNSQKLIVKNGKVYEEE